MKACYIKDDLLGRMVTHFNYYKFRIGSGDTHYRPNRLDWATCWAIAAFARFMTLPEELRANLWAEVETETVGAVQ